jgi:hypothetical protein
MTYGFVTRQTKVSDVSGWDELYQSDTATVWEAENVYGYYKVKYHKTSKTKYYKGESAWMNIQRDVVDAGDWGGWSIFE